MANVKKKAWQTIEGGKNTMEPLTITDKHKVQPPNKREFVGN